MESISLWTCNSTAVVESWMTDADCWRQALKITSVCWADLSVPGLSPKSTSATRFPQRPITLPGIGHQAHPQTQVITNRLVWTSIHRMGHCLMHLHPLNNNYCPQQSIWGHKVWRLIEYWLPSFCYWFCIIIKKALAISARRSALSIVGVYEPEQSLNSERIL